MRPIATEAAKVRCSHGMGRASPVSSVRFLRFAGRAALAADDLAFNGVTLCPVIGPAVKPCTATLPLVSGASRFVRANGRPLALLGATGGTDGVPPGVTLWSVLDAGQTLVRAGG